MKQSRYRSIIKKHCYKTTMKVFVGGIEYTLSPLPDNEVEIFWQGREGWEKRNLNVINKVLGTRIAKALTFPQ